MSEGHLLEVDPSRSLRAGKSLLRQRRALERDGQRIPPLPTARLPHKTLPADQRAAPWDEPIADQAHPQRFPSSLHHLRSVPEVDHSTLPNPGIIARRSPGNISDGSPYKSGPLAGSSICGRPDEKMFHCRLLIPDGRRWSIAAERTLVTYKLGTSKAIT
jgi:hypothetical protein